MRRLLSILALVALPCHAGIILPNGAVNLEYVAGGVRYHDYMDPHKTWNGGSTTFQGRTFTAPAAQGGAMGIAEKYGMKLGGASIAVTVGRTIAAAGLANAVVAVGTGWGVGWQIGTALSDYLRLGDADGGSRVAPLSSASADPWGYDEGEDPGQSMQELWKASGESEQSPWHGSAQEAAKEPANNRCQSNGWGNAKNLSEPQRWPSSPNLGDVFFNCDSPNGGGSVLVVARTQMAPKPCTPYIDALNPLYNNAKPIRDSEGKCPTGRYTPASKELIKDILSRVGVPSPKIAEEILDKGGTIPAADGRDMSGPGSVTGQPQTTRETIRDPANPDAPPTVRETTRTPTTEFEYGNDGEIDYREKERVQIRENGELISDTEKDEPGQESPEETGEVSDNPVQCDKYPDSLGCAEMGDPPDDKPVWKDKEVKWENDDLGLGSGSCPPDRVWTVHAIEFRLKFQPACDVAPTIKAASIVFTLIGCILMINRTVTAS